MRPKRAPAARALGGETASSTLEYIAAGGESRTGYEAIRKRRASGKRNNRAKKGGMRKRGEGKGRPNMSELLFARAMPRSCFGARQRGRLRLLPTG